MATNFPTSLDALDDPTGSESLAAGAHAAKHTNVNDAVEALEAKVGVNGSAVTSSLDYLVKSAEAPGHTHNAAYATSSGQTNLTNDTVSALGISEQWGTEMVTFADPGRAVSVLAWLAGSSYMPNAGTRDAFAEVEISFDAGATWTRGESAENTHVSGGTRVSLAPHHRRNGTPAGQVQVRAMIQQAGGTAGDITFIRGSIMAVML